MRFACWGLMIVGLCGLGGCERESPPPKRPTSQALSQDHVRLPQHKPSYTFAAGLEERFPDVVGFMRGFLETCLAGDYSGYRRAVARSATPESRARFERILHALQTLDVESIDELHHPALPDPSYRVVGRAEFRRGDHDVVRRRGRINRIAILVFTEDGELRMTLAPAELQPPDEEPTTTASATASAPATSSGPSYPWDADDGY